MDKKKPQETKKVNQADFRADPTKFVRLALQQPIEIVDAQGTSKGVICFPSDDDQ